MPKIKTKCAPWPSFKLSESGADPRLPAERSRTKPPPEGFDEIEDILEEYNRKMRDGASLETLFCALPVCTQTRSGLSGLWTRPDPLLLLLPAAEAESHEGKRKTESLWPIMRITHTRSRCVGSLPCSLASWPGVAC